MPNREVLIYVADMLRQLADMLDPRRSDDG